MSGIHPTAIVDPGAQLGEGVTIGPFSVIGPKVVLGDRVQVTPVDYGLVPVAGELVACSAHEIVLARETPETGAVMTHFPAPGFEIAKR